MPRAGSGLVIRELLTPKRGGSVVLGIVKSLDTGMIIIKTGILINTLLDSLDAMIIIISKRVSNRARIRRNKRQGERMKRAMKAMQYKVSHE